MNSRVIDTLDLPYVKSVNPVTYTDKPYFVSGQNTLIQQNMPLARRPGFQNLVTSFGANEKLVRVFTWSRWNGTFYTMYCTVNTVAGTSTVWHDGANSVFSDTSSTEPFDFVVSNNFIFFSNGNKARKWDGTTVTNWGIDPQPTTAPTISNVGAGNVPGAVGHAYVYAYGVSTTGYVSDISDQSAGTTAANRQWTVTGPKCTDTQCDQVHIYRTEDGGDIFYELSGSPIANPAGATWSITDNDFDASSLSSPRLDVSAPAPIRGVNQKPTPIKGLRLFAGRIWGFKDDTVYFSGLEEITNSVPEECFGTALTNSQSFGREVTGIEVLGGSDVSILLVFTRSGIFFVAGNSLLTFRIGTFAQRRGCHNRATITAGQIDVGGVTYDFVAWLDVSNSVRMVTTSSGVRDISADISSDIESINHSQASIAVHEDGAFRWLILCDGAAATLRTLDLTTGRWNVPWPIANKTPTIIASGEISAGTHYLFLGAGVQALRLNRTIFEDDSASYSANVSLSLIPLAERERPDRVSNVDYVGIERNASDIADISYLLDNDPINNSPSYTSILANVAAPFLRNSTPATLAEKWYYLRDKSGARRVSVRISWGGASSDFKLFSITIVSTSVEDGT